MNLANAFTVGNLYCGFLAAICTIMGHETLALTLLMSAFFCDGLDGYFARKHQATSAFGERLDSLADLVSFGIAPALFALWAQPTWQVQLILVVGVYVVCGALRLARYDPREQSAAFRGLPIPMAGLFLSSMSRWYGNLPWFELAPAVIGMLMISDITFMKVKFTGPKKLLPLTLGVFGLVCLLVFNDLTAAVLAFTLPYLVLNLALAVASSVQTRVTAVQAARVRNRR